MNLKDRIREQLGKSEWLRKLNDKPTPLVFFVLLSGLVTLIGFVGKVLDEETILAGWLVKAVYTDPDKHVLRLHLWSLVMVFAVLTTICSLALLLIWEFQRMIRPAKEKLAIEEMMAAVRQIRDQGKQTRIKAWDEIRFRYLINKDLSGSETRTGIMRSVSAPVHFYESVTVVEDDADPAENLAAVKYRVRDLDAPASDIVYLPSENGSRSKKACLFFLPPIKPGTTRRFETFFEWPGMFKRLKTAAEAIEFSTTTEQTLSVFQIEIYLEEGSGYRLECHVTGNTVGAQTLKSNHYQVNGWRGQGHVYRVEDAPAGDLRFVLRAELKD